MTHLNPVRHHLNLTVRGGVFVRKILIEDGRAVGVEAESGGKVFQVEADRVVLSAGAIRSPHLLMLSGIGPEDHLRQFGIPTVRHLPGVGQNLMNHLSAQVTFKVKDGVSLAAHRDAAHFALHYTAEGSSAVNDMVLRTSPVVDERAGARPRRADQVPGRRRSPRAGGADLTARSGCPTARDTSGWPRPTPASSRAFNYCYLQHPNDVRRVREGLRMAAKLLESDAYQGRGRLPDPPDGRHSGQRRRFGPAGYARPSAPPGTCPGPARWDRMPIRWRSSTNTAGSRASKGCGWPTRR